MRIQHVMPPFARIPGDPAHDAASGIVRAALSFAEAAARNGHQVGFVGWADGAPRTTVTPDGVRVDTHPGYRHARFARWDLRWLAPMMVRSLRRPAPDILHVHADVNQLRMRGSAKILHIHTPMPNEVPPAYRALLRHADAAVACSAFTRGEFLAATGWDPSRTHVVPNGTDLDRFHPATAPERSAARARFGVASEALVVLYVGAVVPEKGVVQLARACAGAAGRLSRPLTFVIAGAARLYGGMPFVPWDPSGYEQQVQAESPPSSRWLGKVPYQLIPAVYQAADVVVHPALWGEPFGMSALDGSTSGLPVIASAVGGLPEVVVDGETGLLVPPGDEAALAAAIVRLGEDDDLRARLGAAGRARAELFAWDRVAGGLAEVYARALERRAGRVARAAVGQ